MSLENYSTTIILGVLSIFTLITGYWFFYDPPKKINSFYGFRTKKSMRSQEQWDFAQRFSGKLFFWFGIGLMVLALLAYIFKFNSDIANVIVVAIFVMGALLILYKTEKGIDKELGD